MKSIRIRGFGLTAAAVLLVAAHLGGATPASAQITGYDPASICRGYPVRLQLSRAVDPDRVVVRIGNMGTGMVIERAGLSDWPNVVVPETLAPGTYWIGIANEGMLTRGPATLRVNQCIDVGPLEFATEAYIETPELELVSVEQIGGSRRVPVGQDLNLRLRVRNRGSSQAGFKAGAIHRSTVVRGDNETLPRGETRNFDLALPIREGDDGGSLTVFLAHTGSNAGNLFTAMYKDDNQRDNMKQFSYGVAAATYNVTVDWHSLQILHRCDDLSPGDWRFRVGAYASSWENEVVPDTFRRVAMWMSRDVGEETVHTPQSMVLPNVAAGDTISIRSSGWDCDSDEVGGGGLDWARIFVWPHYWEAVQGFLGATGSFDNCAGDEEVHEFTGKHDTLGTRTLELSPTQWQNGGRFELPADQLGSCRANGGYPYRMWVRVRATGS